MGWTTRTIGSTPVQGGGVNEHAFLLTSTIEADCTYLPHESRRSPYRAISLPYWLVWFGMPCVQCETMAQATRRWEQTLVQTEFGDLRLSRLRVPLRRIIVHIRLMKARLFASSGRLIAICAGRLSGISRWTDRTGYTSASGQYQARQLLMSPGLGPRTMRGATETAKNAV